MNDLLNLEEILGLVRSVPDVNWKRLYLKYGGIATDIYFTTRLNGRFNDTTQIDIRRKLSDERRIVPNLFGFLGVGYSVKISNNENVYLGTISGRKAREVYQQIDNIVSSREELEYQTKQAVGLSELRKSQTN